MALTRAATERTGQKSEAHASWWMVSPRCPFFWLSIISVTEEAAARVAASLVCGSNVWPCQKRVSHTRN